MSDRISVVVFRQGNRGRDDLRQYNEIIPSF